MLRRCLAAVMISKFTERRLSVNSCVRPVKVGVISN